MQGSKQDIEIDQPITYSLATDTFNKSLKIINRSDSIYVFKVKTNQRSVISMQLTHDFIKPNSTKQIIIKLAEKPSETTPLKLQLNYAIPSEQQIRINDSKMNSYTRDNVFRRIVTVSRDDSVNPVSPPTTTTVSDKIKTSVSQLEKPPLKFVSQQLKITPKKQEKPIVVIQQKQQKKQQKKEVKKQQKVQQRPYKQEYIQEKVKYQSGPSYVPTQAKSEQITILTGKSAQIDISEMIIEAPASSQEAIKAYLKPIQVPRPVVVEEKKDYASLISENERNEDYSYANSSPANKRSFLQQFNSRQLNSNEQTLEALANKISNQKLTIHKLRCEQVQDLKSDCVYPVPILYLIVLLAFLSGSFVNWIAS